MGSPFVITVLSDSIRMGEDLSGRAIFTVENHSGVARNVRASVESDPVEGTGPRLSLEGAAERHLEVQASDQFNVAIDGEGTPPGKYVFRLRVVAEDDPDEIFAEGGNVEVEVPKTEEPEEPEPRPFPWWIPVAAAAMLILGTVAFLLLRDGEGEFGPPTLVSPANEAVVNMPFFSTGVQVTWNEVPGAESYTVDYQICPPCSSSQASVGASPLTIPVEVDRTVTWSVLAHMGELQARSEMRTFTTQLRLRPTGPLQTIPFETFPFGEGD